jgi:hypothetical protein
MTELNIVELIEKNPIVKLSNAYNNKLLIKIKENFTGFEQQLFVSSFYCYLNYDKNIDFVVDLDNVWEWLGFTQKISAIRVLEKHFKLGVDYKNLAPQVGGASSDEEKNTFLDGKAVLVQPKINGGQNKLTIMLTIKCFKSFCLKAQTKKASEIHEYYMKMEETLHQIVEEETDELRMQLEQKENIIIEKDNVIIKSKKEKLRAVEQATIAQFPLNTECIYFGTIDNTNDAGEKLIKFGHTNNLSERVLDHHKKYINFILVAAFRVQNKVEIENLIKAYPKIKRNIRNIEVNGKNKTEIIAYDSTNFTIEKIIKHIKDIIHSKTYSIDNFNKLLQRNEELENENRELKEQMEKNKSIIAKQNLEINEIKETAAIQKSKLDSVNLENNSVYQNILLPEDEMTKKFNEFVDTICIVRPDVEESSVNIEGRYRLWSQMKPSKEVFHALKNYLDTRFKPKRIQTIHGYLGIKLKSVEYKKVLQNSIVETFIFQVCHFSDCGKILNSVLLKEYQKWKISVNKELSDNDMKEIKEYLNSSLYALKATVWTEHGNNEGYYGLSLRCNDCATKPKLISSTGKKVEKRETNTNNILGTWETIIKAALFENISAAKMSRCVKNKTIIGDYYYCTTI